MGRRAHIWSEKVKYVDDGTVAVTVDLKACLVDDPVDRPRPLNKHERTKHILPDQVNLLQFYIQDTENFTKTNKLVINKKKTNIMIFNKSKTGTFHLNYILKMEHKLNM